MRKILCLSVGGFLGLWAVILGLSTPVGAQEVERVGCDPADPAKNCPGEECSCVDDILEVVFDGIDGGDPVFEYDTFAAGMEIDMWQIGDIVSQGVQGWSLGVSHVGDDLDLLSVTYIGGPGEMAVMGGISILDFADIQSCVDGVLDCKNVTVPDFGYIQAVIMHFKKMIFVEPGVRHAFATAKYALKRDVMATGTRIQVTSGIGKADSPPTDVNLTIGGQSRTPSIWIDGLIRQQITVGDEVCDDAVDNDQDGLIDCLDVDDCADDLVACPPDMEICDDTIDNDGDGLIDCLDSDCVGTLECPTDCAAWGLYFGSAQSEVIHPVGAGTTYAISMRNVGDSLGFQLGVSLATNGATTTHTFAGTLGRENAPIDLLISDDTGTGQTPETPNTATSDISTVANVVRGAAIAAFQGDFFAWDGDPEVGGPGFTAVHVADLAPPVGQVGNVIPATAAEGVPCPVNEVLVVTLGIPDTGLFSRGDADGDSKLNVLDAILIIQFAVTNLPLSVDCMKAYDADDDGAVDVMDAIPVLMYAFQQGPALASPFGADVCAVDGTPEDSLTCTTSNCQ